MERCSAHGAPVEEVTVKPVGLQPGRRYARCSLALPQRCQYFRLIQTMQNGAPRQDFRRFSVEMPGRSAPFFGNGAQRPSNGSSSFGIGPRLEAGMRPGSAGNARHSMEKAVRSTAIRGAPVVAGSRPGSGGGTSSVREDEDGQKCKCGQGAVKRTVRKDGPNKGKQFWVCRKPQGDQCRFFEWAESSPSVGGVQTAAPGFGQDVAAYGQQKRAADGFRHEEPNWAVKKRPRPSLRNQISIDLEEIGDLSFKLHKNSPDELKDAVKLFDKAKFTKTNFLGVEKVVIPIESFFAFETFVEANAGTQVVHNIPREIISRILEYRWAEKRREEQDDIFTRSLEGVLPAVMCEKLMEFQWEGIHFALKRGGRCLIGDDMGLGKTLQAIAVARVYMNDWPLLIVCPSSLRLNWKEELLRWLEDDIVEDDILVIMSGRDIDRPLRSVNIVSYDLLRKIPPNSLRRCQFIIADESHYLKSMTAKRSQALTPLIKKAKRALLLSGTPALSRPVELFPQINSISPILFPRYQEYVERYCAAHMGRFGYDVSGASNLDELHTLLRGSLLIRRKKEEVLSQLPDKQRQVLWVQTKPKVMKDVAKAMDAFEDLKLAAKNPTSEGHAKKLDCDIKAAQTELYKLTGSAKIESVMEFCKDTAETGCKFIVFLHHKEVMSELDEYITKKLKLGIIRIDGSTPQSSRQMLCREFQEDPKCRVALLSITAAGVGLTLTKATVVLFAELYWNPGSLLQAEDRAHRIGQRDCVLVKYLLAKKTLDESMWSTVRRKLTVVGHSLTGTAARMDVTENPKAIESTGGSIASFFKPKPKPSALKGSNDALDDDIIEVEDDSQTPQGTNHNQECPGRTSEALGDDEMFPTSLRDLEEPYMSAMMEDRVHGGVQHDHDKEAAKMKQAQMDADIALARKLQAEFDMEDAS